MHFIDAYQGWFSDTELSLLKSISKKAPDYVTGKLRPFAFQDETRDRQILWTLCHDANDDSDRMFQLRCQLLKKNSALFQNFWGFYELIKKNSIRAVDLFDIIIENWELKTNAHIYISEKENWEQYASSNYQLIVNKLFPKICKMTYDYQPTWPYYAIGSELSEGTIQDYNESVIRQIVEIV